jgi:hypothetical protein
MEKPTGKWKCRACGAVCEGHELLEHTHLPAWTCKDPFCGGTCIRLPEPTPPNNHLKPSRKRWGFYTGAIE